MQANPQGQLRPFRAALLSALVPGTGQVYAGARRRGWVMIGIDGVLLVAALVYVLRGELEIAKDWVRPGALAVMMVVNVAPMLVCSTNPRMGNNNRKARALHGFEESLAIDMRKVDDHS